MKVIVTGVWAAGVVLAIMHLRFLAGSELHPGFWPFTGFLLVCYSLPFFWLTRIHIPAKRSPQKYIILTLFLMILTISLLLPTRRFLPGYHPEALEGLAYLFVPSIECGLIGLFLIAGIATDRLTQKR